MDLTSDYLTQQIIAYIGNKRRLLDLIGKAIETIMPEMKPGIKFLDLFAGSGIVSRFAKQLNFELYINDWEYYSYILNSGFIKTNKNDIDEIFGSEDNFLQLLDHLNKIPDPPDNQTYIAKYYAPKNFDHNNVDFNTERLFYTRQNALTIDKIRNYIDINYPAVINTEITTEKNLISQYDKSTKARDLLLSILIYEAATHTNTSGVFKAFHKGFGGHNGDAIKRITSPILMNPPFLIDSDSLIHLYREDANQLVRKIDNVDIAYLDPPYNQHQYGSNYHMLNTIALWDKIPAPHTLNEKGVLKEKAAIRKDWINTKSNYCYSHSALSSFTDLIENLNARFILISYSTDGIIPFEYMKEICAQKGEISIVTNEYTKFRGGKQSNNRLNTNIEFILVVNCEKKSTNQSMEKVDVIIAKKKLLLLFKQKFSYSKIKENAVSINNDRIIFNTGKRNLTFKTKLCFEIYPSDEISELSEDEMTILYKLLTKCICKTKEDELEELILKSKESFKITEKEKRYFLKLIPDTLKKLAHKKNKDRYFYWLNKIKMLELYPSIKDKIEAMEILANKRFGN